ncbi:MAG TPA: hypothetical protein VGB18_07880 [Candidatus Thermoplasmatota archaeon]
MPTRAEAALPPPPVRTTCRFWMIASTVHLALITTILAATLFLPYLTRDLPQTLGGALSLVLVLLLLVPYIWFTAFAARTAATMREPTTKPRGFPLRILKRINLVGFLFDAVLLVAATLYLAATTLPRLTLILLITLLAVIAFALPPAVFVAKIQLTRIGQPLADRLDELRRLRKELRRQHDPTRRT